MSFQKININKLVDQFAKALEEIKKTIHNIPDEKTLRQLRTNFSFLQYNEIKISDELDKGVDPNCDTLQVQYNQACSEFDANQNYWDSILKKEEAKYQKYHEEENHQKQMANLTDEQRLEMQQSDEFDYIGRQLATINQMQEDLNKIAHDVDKKITEDHEKVVKIDDHIENAKNEMAKGNKELDKAEKDQKKCNIC